MITSEWLARTVAQSFMKDWVMEQAKKFADALERLPLDAALWHTEVILPTELRDLCTALSKKPEDVVRELQNLMREHTIFSTHKIKVELSAFGARKRCISLNAR